MIGWGKRNAEIMSEFRANDGVVGEYDKLPISILQTIGAKSGGHSTRTERNRSRSGMG